MAISETRVRPPEFIEAAGKTFLGDLSTAVGDFKGADLSKVYGAQNVAGLDPLQQQAIKELQSGICLLYTSPSPRDGLLSRMPSSA